MQTQKKTEKNKLTKIEIHNVIHTYTKTDKTDKVKDRNTRCNTHVYEDR
jgi:hypothetical protein